MDMLKQVKKEAAGEVCPICGMEEPPLWWTMPMNEKVRERAMLYIPPPVIYHFTLWDAINAWGETEGLECTE